MTKISAHREWSRAFWTTSLDDLPIDVLHAFIAEVGKLNHIFWQRQDGEDGVAKQAVVCFHYLILLSDKCGIALEECVFRKLDKNRKKYPKELCKGKADKYTAYTSRIASSSLPDEDVHTEECVKRPKIDQSCADNLPTAGVSESLQETGDGKDSIDCLIELRDVLREFANERDWNQYHAPRNLLLALTGEVGEVAEIFQWKGYDNVKCGLPGFSEKDKLAVENECSDCLTYLVRFSDKSGFDLSEALLDWQVSVAKA